MKLTQSQVLALKILNGYKSFAREENFNYEKRDQAWVYQDEMNSLVALGLLKKNKKGSFVYTLDFELAETIILANKETSSNLEVAILERSTQLKSLREKHASMPSDVWPMADKASVADQIKYTEKQLHRAKNALFMQTKF